MATAVAGTCVLALAAGCSRGDKTGGGAHGDVQPGDVIDAYDEAGLAAQVRIDGVTPDPRVPGLTLYAASIRPPKSTKWVPYCSPDRDGRNAAIPLDGVWTVDGRAANKQGVTLACTSGAIGKCLRFGYRPWETVAGANTADLLVACMRMVRADYCGDGKSHTRDGTLIDVYDRWGIQKIEEHPDKPERFEAAWGVHGATYLTVPRWADDPAEIVRECPDKLTGRVGPALPPGEIAKRFPETLLFDNHPVSPQDRLPTQH